jgi:hypothetical protein
MNVAVLRRALAINSLVLLTALLPTLTRGATLPLSVEVDKAAIDLDTAITDAVSMSLARRPAHLLTGTRFRVISATTQPDWALVSVVALDDPHLDPHAPDAGGLSKLVLVQQLPDGTWEAAIDGEPAFARLLEATPAPLLAADAKTILGPDPTLKTNSTVSYKFPWPSGQAWGWWQGWHTSAHDLGTTSTDRRVLAAAEGVVSAVYSCTLSTIIDLKHADGAVFRYIHIDKQSVDTASLRVGVRIPQGFVLGVVKPDTWSDGNCGYTTQSPGWAHIHWVMPTDRPITLDGWTITFPSNTWRKDSVTKVPGYGAASTLPSTNVPITSTQPVSSNLRQRMFLPVLKYR